MDAVTMDFKQPVGNTSGFGWPSCCHMSYWLAQGHIFLRSSVAFSFLGMNTALGYKRFEYHLERNGIPQAFINTASNHSFVSVEAFIHFLFGGVPNNRGDKCIPSENVKTMRQFVLNKITEVKNGSNVNETTPGDVLDGSQTFDPLSDITAANNLQVMNDSEQTGSGATNEQGSQQSPIVVYIQTQENRAIENAGETAPFPHIRYTDPLPSFQQEGGNPEPEPTSDVTCEVMASGFGGGQEGNRETFLEGELRTISTLAEQELQYCIHGGSGHENCWICTKGQRKATGNDNADKPFRCETCNKSFPAAAHLKRHQKTHTGEKPHQCQQCGKAFALAQNLKLHMRIHTGEKPYSCTFCEKKFPGYSDLAKHVRIHTGERPYKCEHCDQSFASASGLRRHHLVHTGEKPHGCPHCEKTFRRRWHLILHIRAHTGETPHACHLCDKAYRDKTSLNKHLRDHLSGKLEEKQRLKEERAAILAAKTLARSSASLRKRRRKNNIRRGKKTSEGMSTSQQGVAERAGDTNTEERANADASTTAKKAPTRKRSGNKGDKEPPSKRGRKKKVQNTSTAAPSGTNESGCSGATVVGVHDGNQAVRSSETVNINIVGNNLDATSQGEKLQALADAATIHASNLLTAHLAGEQATASTEDNIGLASL